MIKLPKVELKEQLIDISKVITQVFYKDIERNVINKYKQMRCLDSPDTYKQMQNEIETIVQYCITSGYSIIYEDDYVGIGAYNFLQDKLDKIEKKCLKEQKKFVGIYDDSGRCYSTNSESAKFAKSILRIINKEVK